MSDPLFVVLVSGDPEGHDDGFARCAWLRVAELVAQFYRDRKKTGAVVLEDSVLRFIHFDCHTATVGIYEHDFAKQKGTVRDPSASAVQRNWKTLDADFKTAHGVLDLDFVEWKQIKAAKAAHAISIVNVYHSVREAPPGSVLELSIFSHAFVDGPVLYAQTKAPSTPTRRSPDDPDGRAMSDFQPDMGEDGVAEALKKFREAFAHTGSFRIWGCNIQDVVVTVPPEGGSKERSLIMSTVRQVVEAAFTRQITPGKTLAKLLRNDKPLPPGDTKITLDMGGEIADEVEIQTKKDPSAGVYTPFPPERLFQIRYEETFDNHSYQQFFRGEKDSNGDFAKKITRSLSDVVKFVAAETIPSYIFKAAQGLKTVTVVGGAPGTSAGVSDGVQQHIEPGRLDEAFFFSRFFQVAIIDPNEKIKRYYAILDNEGKAVKSILDRAANGLP